MTEVLIHIGIPKTGTTSIQNFLSINRNALKKHNVCYPNFFLLNIYNHFRLGFYLNGIKEKSKYIPIKFRENFNKFSKVIISAESIYALPRPWLYGTEEEYWKNKKNYLEQLKKYFNGHSIKIVLYLRRQDDYLESQYNQRIKVNDEKASSVEIQEWIKIAKPLLDYASQIALLEEIFGKENLIIRAYDKNAFKNNDLIDDFLNACGIEHLKYEMRQNEQSPLQRNISYDKKTVDFKRMINKYISSRANDILLKDLTLYVHENGLSNRTFLTSQDRINILNEYKSGNEYLYKRYFEPESRKFFSDDVETKDEIENLEINDFMDRAAYLLAMSYNRSFWANPILAKGKLLFNQIFKK